MDRTMKHKKYTELLELNILGELSETEEIELRNHLFECAECNKEYTKLKKMYSVVITERHIAPTDEDLINARARLFNTINSEEEQLTIIEKLKKIWGTTFQNKYKLAFGSIALLLVGLSVGYLLFNNFSSPPTLLTNNIIDLDKLKRGDIKITKVSLPEKFSKNGEFEFKLGDSNPVNYKGNLNDVIVQKLLAIVIKETENPGFKIKTAKIVAEFIPNNFMPDEKIKDAFITTLKTDKNPGVRKEALKALISFPYDNSIRDALLYTLEHDQNTSNRMDAINTLLTVNIGSYSIDNKIKSNLEQGIVEEDNELIKYRTTKLLLRGK